MEPAWYLKVSYPTGHLGEGEGKVHKLVALLLSHFVYESEPQVGNDREVIHSMRLLLLQPVRYSAGRWIYERVICSAFELCFLKS